MNKRLEEIKTLLKASLADVPNQQGFDFQKLYTEKTAEERKCISQAINGSVMLQSMTDEQRDLILGVLQPVEVKNGDWVIRQGEEGDRFYIVEEGSFEVRISNRLAPGRISSKKSSDGGGKLVHMYHGSKAKQIHPSFGELALLYAAPRAASIISKTDGKIWSLHRDALKALILGQDGRKELVSVLRSMSELDGFKDEEIVDFASGMFEKTFKEGTMIITAGEKGSAMYVVSNGGCVINLVVNGGEDLSSNLQAMDYFGQEVITTEDGRYLTDVKATTDTKCWILEKAAIEKSMKKLQTVRDGKSSV